MDPKDKCFNDVDLYGLILCNLLFFQVRERENQDLRDRLAVAMKELQTLKFNMIEISAEASV